MIFFECAAFSLKEKRGPTMTIVTHYLAREGRRGVLCSALILIGFMGFATSGNAQESDEPQGPSDAPDVIGQMTIDGQSYELTHGYWCAPEDGYVAGTTVVFRVAAFDESNDIYISGFHVDRGESHPPYQNVTASDSNSTYRSGDMKLSDAVEPPIRVVDGVVNVRTEFRVGEAEAEFSLPEQPGFPGHC